MNNINYLILLFFILSIPFANNVEFTIVPDDVLYKVMGNMMTDHLRSVAKNLGTLPENVSVNGWIRNPIYDRNGNLTFFEMVGYFGNEPLPDNSYEKIMADLKEIVKNNYRKYNWGGIPFYDSDIGQVVRKYLYDSSKWYCNKNFYTIIASPFYEGFPRSGGHGGPGIDSLDLFAICECFLNITYGETKSWRPLGLIYYAGTGSYKWLYAVDGEKYVMMIFRESPQGRCSMVPFDEAEGIGTREESYLEELKFRKLTPEEYLGKTMSEWEKWENEEVK